MEPEQAALAGELLGARTVVPMHYDVFEIDPWYRGVSEAAGRYEAAAAKLSYESRVLEAGESSRCPWTRHRADRRGFIRNKQSVSATPRRKRHP